MSQPEKAAGKGMTEARGRRKPADFGQLSLGMIRQKARKLSKAAVVLLVIFLLVQVVEGIGYPVLETAQPLPRLCWNWLKQNGCPQRSLFPKRWRDFSQVCCAADPQTVLHCQEPEVNGKTNILAACLPDQTIPPGRLGRLIQNDTGFLEVDLITKCSPGTYRTHGINSSFIRYPYCESKTTDKHAEVVCDGGTTNDDLLVCREGYKSDSSPELKDHNLNPCYRLQCGEGSQPVRNITGYCNDSSSIRVTYGCTAPMSSIEGAVSSRTPRESQESSPVTPSTLTTSSTDNTTKERGWSVYVITGISVGVIGSVVISVFCVCVWCWHQKRDRECGPEISYSVCSSEEKVEIEILPE